MKIHGLQKMTLLDYPGRVACTVFLAGCDMRCPFCHNSDLIDGNAPVLMEDDELIRFLDTRTGLLEGVAFTGGEPILRHDLPDLLRRIKSMGYPVKLDTNGTHPDRLASLIEEKLVDYVAMDVKNSPDRYAVTCGIEGFDIKPVDESIKLLIEVGKKQNFEYEFRTTVVDELHDNDSFVGIGHWIQGASQYFLQAFTDRESVLFSGFNPPSADKMELYRGLVAPFVDKCVLRGVD